MMHEIRPHSIHSSWLSLIHYQVGHTDQFVLLNNLASQLFTRFDHRGDIEDFGRGYCTSEGSTGFVPCRSHRR
ncbi:hypothetical protein P692DRAFT_20570321 [Suillus brevipes Sb2]|nr:hypothetical protein P692DRAFT_20570321 [Suillus brevipes Sb2]